MANGPEYLGLKAVGPYMEPHFQNIGKIFEELLSLHMNLCQDVVIHNQRAIILAFKHAMTHGPEYLGSKAVGPYMELHFHNIGQIFEKLLSLHMNWCQEVVI